MNKIKEKFLISRIRKGDSEAFGSVYDEYIKKVYRFIFFRVPKEEIAQDLSHEVFVKLLNYLKNNSNEIISLMGLIYKICRTEIAGYYSSKQAVNDQAFELSEEIDSRIDKSFRKEDVLDKAVDKKIRSETIMQYIKKINNKEYQEIIILRFIEDMSFVQISEVMNKKINTSRSSLSRALKELKKIIEQKNDK